jgi:succinate dehydrogenase assembly factor 1
MRLSGLQREVLSLYRKCLRGARQKPEVDIECRHRRTQIIDNRNRTLGVISNPMQGILFLSLLDLSDKCDRREFRRNKHVDKKDFAAIEFLLRTGNRKLEMYSAPGITNIH